MLNKNKYAPWTMNGWKQPNFKVDAVVTYVDSKDPSWKALKKKYMETSEAQNMDNSDRWNDQRAVDYRRNRIVLAFLLKMHRSCGQFGW